MKLYYKKKTNRATIKEIALRANVSPATVSRVLTNSPNVSPIKKALVIRAIDELSYRPNPVARSLVSGSFPAVHALLSDMRNPFYSEMSRGVEDMARENGDTVVFGNTDDSLERELEYLNVAKSHQFAGIILMSVVTSIQVKDALRELNRPVVLVNRLLPGFQADSVVLNNEKGGYEATKYLIDLGHKKICFLSGFKNSSASSARLQGFIRAMREAGLDVPDGGVKYGDLRFESGEAFGNYLIEEGLKYTAVFAGNDLMAIGVMAVFSKKNIRVPEDISLIGFDDMLFSSMPGIWLTTVKQPQYEMGRVATKILLDRIKGESSSFKTIIFEPELIERKTCAPPKKR